MSWHGICSDWQVLQGIAQLFGLARLTPKVERRASLERSSSLGASGSFGSFPVAAATCARSATRSVRPQPLRRAQQWPTGSPGSCSPHRWTILFGVQKRCWPHTHDPTATISARNSASAQLVLETCLGSTLWQTQLTLLILTFSGR